MKRICYHPRRKQRQEEAIKRQEKWANKSPSIQLSTLISRGHGHCQQAERLEQNATRQQ